MNLRSLVDFTVYVKENILPFCANIPKHHAPYQHLQYAGCGSIDIGEIAIGGVLFNVYPGLFSSGFTKEEFRTAVGPPEPWIGNLLIPCLHNPALLQVSALAVEDIDTVSQRFSVPPDLRAKVKEIQLSHQMSQQAIEAWLATNIAEGENLPALWSETPLKHLSLTSVGIAIAHANIRRKLKRDDYNLSIWIP